MTNVRAPVKRKYESTLRRDQARATRRAIVDAAGRLFAENGYVWTSVDQIAEAAGVSRATVFAAVGGKPALLKAAFDVGIVGDDEPVSLVERPRSQRILAEPDPYELLAQYAALCTEVAGRLSGLNEAVRGGAHADPEIRELWDLLNAQRRGGADTVVKALLDRGPLADGLDPKSAADIVWMLASPDLYHMLVRKQGWSP